MVAAAVVSRSVDGLTGAEARRAVVLAINAHVSHGEDIWSYAAEAVPRHVAEEGRLVVRVADAIFVKADRAACADSDWVRMESD